MELESPVGFAPIKPENKPQSLYTMIMGINPWTPILLFVVGITGETQEKYHGLGRLRDTYTNEDCSKLFVLHRNYGEAGKIYDDAVATNPNYVAKHATSDETYQIYEFDIPEFMTSKIVNPGTTKNVRQRLRSELPQKYRTPAFDRYRQIIKDVRENKDTPEAKNALKAGEAIFSTLKNMMDSPGEQHGIVENKDIGGSVEVFSIKPE